VRERSDRTTVPPGPDHAGRVITRMSASERKTRLEMHGVLRDRATGGRANHLIDLTHRAWGLRRSVLVTFDPAFPVRRGRYADHLRRSSVVVDLTT
jgi:hypothetical protein